MGAELITFTWKGRQLQSIYDEYNNATLTYTYNDDGIRTKKHWVFEDDSTETIEYILDDNNTLVKQVYTYQYPDDEPEVETIYYFYDETGAPAYLTYNGTELYYVKNLQGDVMGIMTSDGTTVISYGYDAWGNVIEDDLNDFDYYAVSILQVYRYRSYIYDNDTGFYYLQSRYYDPAVGRFINADDTGYLGASGTVLSYNLYAYCENNAVDFIDPTGCAKYNGVIGFGIQILLTANALCYQGFVGFEFIWYTKEDNFGKGLVPWVYKFGGLSGGFSLDLNKLFSDKLITKPSAVLSGLGISFGCSFSISIFIITGNKFQKPKDYEEEFSFWTGTTWGVTISKAWGSRATTYGIGASWELRVSGRYCNVGKMLFGTTRGVSYYKLVLFNKISKSLYDKVLSRV